MNDKLKRLAKNLSELIPDDLNLEQTYTHVTRIANAQKDYFSHFAPPDFLKLIFYIYSFKTTGSFDWADSVLNKISFMVLFITEGTTHTESCDRCSGDGYIECDECNGDGEVTCDECDGDGEVTCDECDGSGEIEDDGTTVTCDECEGQGEKRCDECDSSGRVSCSECDNGRVDCPDCEGGDIDTDELEYTCYFIVTWSQLLKDRAELVVATDEEFMESDDFNELNGEFLILSSDENHAELKSFIFENEFYCSYYNDTPKLVFEYNMSLGLDNTILYKSMYRYQD